MRLALLSPLAEASMQYKISRQYSTDAEILCATFCELADANLFIKKIEEIDTSVEKKPVYWLFDNDKLLNKIDPSTPLHSRYAEGRVPLPQAIEQPFNILIPHDNNEHIIASFSHLNDAKLFVAAKLSDNSDNQQNITYFIFDGEHFVEKCNQDTLANLLSKKEKNMVFRPTPFRNAPRLGPSHWLIDDEDKKS
jgi:hypothetical protein